MTTLSRPLCAALLALAVLFWRAPLCASADDAKTFTVIEGAAPWFDRVGVWSLTKVPDSLNGSGPIPQQNCSSRALELSGKSKSIVLGVSVGDLAAFEHKFPLAKESGESISVKNTAGTEIAYKVLTLASPPDRIDGAGVFGAGLLLLKLDASAYKPAVAATAAAAKLTPSPAVVLPKKPLFHIYLLMGQSNMVGRDTSGIDAQVDNPRILALDGNNHWVIAREPMHSGGSGIGPGISFAAAMLKANPKISIGLVPCAVGGTPLSRWVKGADLYARAVERAKAAAEAGTIKGALWHQGESDTSDRANAESYGSRLTQMFTDLRQDLGLPKMPIVVGQLGMFLTPQNYASVETVRAAIAGMPAALPNVGFADSQGLTDKGDRLHFNSASQAQFGQRYAKAMLALQKGQAKKPLIHGAP